MWIEFNNSLICLGDSDEIHLQGKRINIVRFALAQNRYEEFDTEEEAKHRYVELKGKLVKPHLCEMCNDHIEEG